MRSSRDRRPTCAAPVRWREDAVRTLEDLFAYNAWANARVFGVCRDADRAQLGDAAPGTRGTLAETLQHLVVVEDVYARLLRGDPTEELDSREEHDLAWLADRSARLGEEYTAILGRADAAFLEDELRVPWFDFRLTKHDGLLQVLSHSSLHRAQVFSVLGQRGAEVPDLDFVDFVESRLAGDA
jgi:uncharacterized damage-inducible protein DinB